MTTTTDDHGRIPLLLIHGAWLSTRSWENYADYFDKKGFAVSAPEWPRKHGDVEQMRETSGDSAGLGVTEIVDHYADLIAELDRAAGDRRSFLRRPRDRAAARPRPRTGRRGDEPGAAEGDPGAAVLDAQGRRSSAGSSWQVARRRDAQPRGVHLRLREHLHARGGEGRLRPLRRSRDRPDLLRGRIRELPPPPADRGALQECGACAAPDRRRRRGPHRAGIALEGPVQALRALPCEDRLPRVRGPARTSTWSRADWEEVAAAIDNWLAGVLATPLAGAAT